MSANISPENNPVGEDQPVKGIVNGVVEPHMDADMLLKLNKKIAQLTKVVYGLNTRGEELEAQLITSKENEEKARKLNDELQYRVNNFKAKIEAEMGKLKELETQATQAQYWKREFEGLKRRFDAEQLVTRDADCLLEASEEIEEHERREKALKYELEQLKHTVGNLKAQHEFIMQERDTQMKFEREKVGLDWQERITDIEGRYKSQLRRAAEEVKVMADECNSLRLKISTIEESGLKEQIMSMKLAFDTEKKDFLKEIRQKSEDAERERGEIIELQRKLHVLNEEKRKIEEKREEELSAASQKYESKVAELQNKYEILQELDESREQEFELKLKSKIQEWRTDRDNVEEGYRSELKNLRQENDQLVSDLKTIRYSANKSGTDLSNKVKELETDLETKSRETEIKTKNFKVRINMLETKNSQLAQERLELQNKLEADIERYKEKDKSQETIYDQVVRNLEERIKQGEETERNYREMIAGFNEGESNMKKTINELKMKIREVHREGDLKCDRERDKMEAKTKQKIERIWMEKIQIAEDVAAAELIKSKEEWKMKEDTLRNEVQKADMIKEEGKKGNEDLRKKIRELRQQELDSGKRQNVIETQLNSLKREEEMNSRKLKEVESQANRYQHQVDQLTVKVTQEQQLVFQLRQDLEDAQKNIKQLKQDLDQSRKQNSTTTSLEIRIQELGRQLRDKEAANDSIRVDFQYEKKESEISKSKIRRIQEELSKSEKTIQKQEKQLMNRNQDSSKMNDFEEKIKLLEDKLIQSESIRRTQATTLQEIEDEREEEMKIVQDALDEAAQEREDLIKTFQKELDHANTMNTAREQQMLEDFEWKLREMQKENKKTLDEIENQSESTLHKKKHNEEDEYKIKLEKAKKEINSEWEDRLRQEYARLKVCLESKYEQEQDIIMTDLRNKKEQECHNLKRAGEAREKEMNKEMSNLRKLLAEKESTYQNETENLRTNSDRDIWQLRMKLQRLNDTMYDNEQKMVETHSEELERLRIDYDERIKEMNSRIEDYESRIGVDTISKITEQYKKQMEYLGQQHKLSMERLREESESDKFQCVEEARLVLTNHFELLNQALRESISENEIKINQYKHELQHVRELAEKRKETIQNYEEQQQKQLQTLGYSLPEMTSNSSGILSQYSTETQSFHSSQDSQNSQDTGSCSDSGHEDNHKNGGGSLLGKVFGGGWFQPHKSRRGSTPLTSKKAY